MRWTGITVLAAVALLGGCDAQAGSDYNGQPLASLKGTVQNQSGIPPAQQIDAALLWLATSTTSPDAIMSVTPVTIEKLFPAQFTITIYLPPPAAALQQSTLPYAVADVGALVHAASAVDIASGVAVLGRVTNPELYYFASDVPAGLMAQQYGALKKGYHLFNRQEIVDPATLSQAQIDSCASALTGQIHVAYADAQQECAQSLLSRVSHEVPLSTPMLLQVRDP